jgi:protoporphyrinogen oxidase
VVGGYRTVLDRLQTIIEESGGRLNLGSAVQCVAPVAGGGVEVQHAGGTEVFDKVVFTGPVNVLQRVADPSMIDIRYSGKEVEYLGVLCMALVTRVPLTSFYVLNIADERIPFTGVIGMSTVVDTDETGGRYLTYLPKYMLSTDEEMKRDESELRAEFLRGLRLIFPELSDEDVISAHIHRAFKVQPLQVLNFSSYIPRTETRHEDFYILNTAQFVNNTLNNNEVIRAVDKFMRRFADDFSPVMQDKAKGTDYGAKVVADA